MSLFLGSTLRVVPLFKAVWIYILKESFTTKCRAQTVVSSGVDGCLPESSLLETLPSECLFRLKTKTKLCEVLGIHRGHLKFTLFSEYTQLRMQ